MLHPVVALRASDTVLDDATYVRATLRQLWEEMPMLLLAALILDVGIGAVLWLMLGGAMPLAALAATLLVGPCWAAFCYVVGRQAAQLPAGPRVLLSALVHYFPRSVLLGAPEVLLVLLYRMTWPALQSAPALLGTAAVALQVILLGVLALILLYGVALLAAFDLPLRRVWAYALSLMVRWPGVGIGLLSLAFLLGLAARAIGLGAWLILPAVWVPFQTNAVLMLTRKVVLQQRQQ